jgi:hypothetical protein
MHTYKCIRYGKAPVIPENDQNVAPNKPIIDSSKTGAEDGKPSGILKKKSVKISDEGFLKNMKDVFTLKKIDFGGELKFIIDNPDGSDDKVRLSDLQVLIANFNIF